MSALSQATAIAKEREQACNDIHRDVAKLDDALKKAYASLRSSIDLVSDGLSVHSSAVDDPQLVKVEAALKDAIETFKPCTEAASDIDALKRAITIFASSREEDENAGAAFRSAFAAQHEAAAPKAQAEWKRARTEMLEKVKRGMASGDADVVAQADASIEERIKCPITRTIMMDPVRSRVCGHNYSREGINQILSLSSPRKCPVAGCKSMVQKSDLEESMDIRVLLERPAVKALIEKRERGDSDDDVMDGDE